MNYDELVKALNETDFSDGCPCEAEELCKDGECIILQAADAIEELHKKYLDSEVDNTNLTEWLAEEYAKHLWIPVTERLPEPGVPCICWCKGGTCGQIRWYGLYYLTSHRTWAFYDNDFIDNREVTHWMYRPEPPKEET